MKSNSSPESLHAHKFGCSSGRGDDDDDNGVGILQSGRANKTKSWLSWHKSDCRTVLCMAFRAIPCHVFCQFLFLLLSIHRRKSLISDCYHADAYIKRYIYIWYEHKYHHKWFKIDGYETMKMDKQKSL